MINFNSKFSNERIDLRRYINDDETIQSEIVIRDCFISEITGSMVSMSEIFEIIDSSIFHECIFLKCTFIGNLTIDNCWFRKTLKFESCLFFGKLEIRNSHFTNDLEFYDNTFKSEVLLFENTIKGNNTLLSQTDEPFSNGFDIRPIIIN